jgi:hypothetical protein
MQVIIYQKEKTQLCGEQKQLQPVADHTMCVADGSIGPQIGSN